MGNPFDAIRACYPPESRRALDAQRVAWSESRPLEGLRILDATPLFRNTLLKHEALLVAGAELWIGYGRAMPYDPEIARSLPEFGLRTADEACLHEGFDIVLDCAAAFSDIPSRFGYAELTRSGLDTYATRCRPVYLADGGHVKLLETALGTGDGLVRALKVSGYPTLKGLRIAVAGSGKVGSGILFRCLSEGATCTAIERPGIRAPFGLKTISVTDNNALMDLLDCCDILVTATGIRHALAGKIPATVLTRTSPILVNMGVEDEFGPEVPKSRVLNAKAPFNFILDEPTELRYIDPTLALHNFAATRLRYGLPPGITMPAPDDEAPILHLLDPPLRAELEAFLNARNGLNRKVPNG